MHMQEVGDEDSEWPLFNAYFFACRGGNTRTVGAEGGLSGLFDQGSPEVAEKYWETRRAVTLMVAKANCSVGEVREDNGEGPSVGLKDVLATQEGKPGLGSGCVQQG